jgi:hypothetical protein
MAFIVVRGKNDDRFLPTVERMLYAGQKIVSDPVINEFGSAMVIVDAGTGSAQYLADRFASGLYGATVFPDVFAAMKYVQDER